MKWTEIEENFLKENYKKISSKEISKVINKSFQTIIQKAKRLGLSGTNRIYYVNNKFFDQNNEFNNYFFGFWIADGSLKKCKGNYNSIYIGVHTKDNYLLYKFKNLIGGSPIKKHKNREFYNLDINSKYLVNKIIEKGAIPNKSLIINYPNIEEKYNNHFVRGFFDGDGTIRIKYRKFDEKHIYPTLEIGFCGGEIFITKLQEKLEIICGKKTKLRKQSFSNKKKMWTCTISYGGKTAEKICDWMYENCNNNSLFLKRKYEIYKNWKELK